MELLNNQYRCTGVRFQLWALTGRPNPVAARLMGLWVRIPVGACMYISCDCSTHSSRGLLRNVVFLSVFEETRRKGPGPLPSSCHEKIIWRISGQCRHQTDGTTLLACLSRTSVTLQRETALCSLNSVRYFMW